MKDLSEMSLEELWQLFPIVIKKYNPQYEKWYEEEVLKLFELVGKEGIERINHIGSSAVKGLIGKPTIDILIEIKEKNEIWSIEKILLENNWILMSSTKTPYVNYVFNKGYTKTGYAERVYHLHVRTPGDWDELYFRDFLLENSDVAEAYGQLKLNLQSKYKNDRDTYTTSKSSFVKRWTDEAREQYGKKYKHHKGKYSD